MAYTDIKNVIYFFEPPVFHDKEKKINGQMSKNTEIALDILFQDEKIEDVNIEPGPMTRRMLNRAAHVNPECPFCIEDASQCICISCQPIKRSDNIKFGYVLSTIDYYHNNRLYYYSVERTSSGEIIKIKSASKYIVATAEKEFINLIAERLPIKEGRTLVQIQDNDPPTTLEVTYDKQAVSPVTYTCVRHHKIGDKEWKTKQNGKCEYFMDNEGQLYSIRNIIHHILNDIYDNDLLSYSLVDYSAL